MFGIIVLLIFEAMGILQAFMLCRQRPRLVRIWLGLVAGLMEMMWLPCLSAFLFRFSVGAHLLSLGIDAVATVLLVALSHTKNSLPEHTESDTLFPRKTFLWLTLLITILSGYLQYTHSFRPSDGALFVGQSTYGDLCFHSSIITGLPNHAFPPDYTILPGNLLGYPFLSDALSGTMYLFGTPLNLAICIPGTLMTVLVFMGFFLFSWELTHSERASVLSLFLMLFNGGLGFFYTLDRMGDTGFSALKAVFTGYYKAPANLTDLNIRWVNFLCDLLIPQRTLTAGWACAIPALYLLHTALKNRKTSDFVALGLFTGPLVMIHTHSFMGVGIISLGVMLDILLRDQEHRKENFIHFFIYGSIACLLALPQLLIWTFPQSSHGNYLRLHLEWVNNTGQFLRDESIWFWIKNVGPMFLMVILAGLNTKEQENRAFSAGSLLLFLLADLILFQPLDYDNNKLFCLAYLAILPLGAAFSCTLYDGLKKFRGHQLLVVLFLFLCSTSGILSIAAELNSNYQIFNAGEVSAADYLKEDTFPDALILSACNHNNVPVCLAGRNIVCGSSTFLYFHGLDYEKEQTNAILMLAFPQKLQSMYESYGIDYVYVSAYERTPSKISHEYIQEETLKQSEYRVDEAELASLYPVVFESGEGYNKVRIYAVSPRAREKYYSGSTISMVN